ncbi:MAG TPA: amidohydrolase family protein [Spirochaetota bacterium]|nr:amidohydrolase family protein [Spirochaetota bacterium]
MKREFFLTLLSLSPPGPECAYGNDSDELAVIANDGIAEIVTAFPDRFSGIASLGFSDMRKSIPELSRCFDELNFAGLQMFPYVRGKGIEGEEFYPVYEILEKRNKPLILHPGSPVNKDYSNYNTGALMGYWFDDAICIIKLILSGMLDKFPDLKILCPHVWSLLPYLVERIDIQTSRFPEFFSAKINKTPGEYLEKIYTDCNNFSPENISFSINKMNGIGRMMFGSDSPFVKASFMVETLMKTGLTEKDLNKILFENAVKFFNISL